MLEVKAIFLQSLIKVIRIVPFTYFLGKINRWKFIKGESDLLKRQLREKDYIRSENGD